MAAFCIDCGARLEPAMAFGQVRPVCRACGHVHFDDKKVAVGVVCALEGRIVLGRRNHEPMLGRWSFPSGFVDTNETLEEAAAREVAEETGLEVRIERLLGAFSEAGARVVFIAYAATVTGGELRAGEENFEVAAFAVNELPELAFPHDTAIVSEWLRPA